MANKVAMAVFLEYTSGESRIQIAEGGDDEVEQRSVHLAHGMSIPMRDRFSGFFQTEMHTVRSQFLTVLKDDVEQWASVPENKAKVDGALATANPLDQ